MTDGTRLKGFAGSVLYAVGRAIWCGGWFCAAGVVVFQMTIWLRDGQWTALPLSAAILWSASQFFPHATSVLTWVMQPASWFGLHEVVSVTPTVAAFALVGFAGMVVADWGRIFRRQASELLRERSVDSSRPDRYSDARVPSGDVDFGFTRADPERNAMSLQQITKDLSPLEQDILRWLRMNGADPGLTARATMIRHLRCSAPDFKRAVATLEGRTFIASIGACLVLSAGGRSHSNGCAAPR